MDFIDKIEINGTLYGLQTLDSGDAYREPQQDNSANIKLPEGQFQQGFFIQSGEKTSKANDNVVIFNVFTEFQITDTWYNALTQTGIEIPLLDLPFSLVNYSRSGTKELNFINGTSGQKLPVKCWLSENTANTNYRQVLKILAPNTKPTPTDTDYDLALGITFILLRSTDVFYGFVEYSQL